jgi:hypothetical protein
MVQPQRPDDPLRLPRFLPRHIRFVIAPRDVFLASSESSPATRGREELRLVDCNEHWRPVFARGVKQDRNAVLTDTCPDLLQGSFVVGRRIEDQMAECVGESNEIAFGIDDGLLNPLRALLQQAPKKMRFARARIALNQQSRREQFFQIEYRQRAR